MPDKHQRIFRLSQDHTEIIDFLQDNSDFQFVLGRPIEVLEELLPPRKHFIRENELIEV